MSGRDRDGNYFGSLVTGILIGMGLFYFLDSTKEGEKVKKKIKEKSKEALNDLANSIGELEEKGEKFRIRAKKLRAELEKGAEEVKKEITKKAKKKLVQADGQRERSRPTNKKFFTKNGKSLSS